jgi:hypothetical protein
MFLPINCQSVNDRKMVAASRLNGVCSTYATKGELKKILVFEYVCSESKKMVACDVVVKSAAGEIYVHDYFLLPDGNWRNSFGEVSETLTSLFPTELLNARCTQTEPIEEFAIGD